MIQGRGVDGEEERERQMMDSYRSVYTTHTYNNTGSRLANKEKFLGGLKT